MSLFAELQRRNVIRMAGLYLVVAWLVVQVAETLLPIFGAPAWVLKTLVGLLAIGFVPTLVFAWLYELTPEGLKRDGEVPPDQSIAAQTAQRMDRLIGVALVAVVALVAADRYWPRDRDAGQPIDTVAVVAGDAPVPDAAQGPVATAPNAAAAAKSKQGSVAVLPFANRSAEPDTAYFVDGVHDDLLTQLSRNPDLKVISRTSVMEYRDTTKKMRQIGQELGVAHLLEGAVQRSGKRVRITAQLIDAASDEHLWAETFDRELTPENVFEIQTEIAVAIAGALGKTLASGATTPQATAAPTRNAKAWDLYLRARAQSGVGTGLDIAKVIAMYRQVLVEEPEFAQAMGELGFELTNSYWFETRRVAERDEARQWIDKALALEPDNPRLRWIFARHLYHGWLDYDAALVQLAIAEQGMPGSADVFELRGWILRRAGRPAEAVESLGVALGLNPRSVDILEGLVETHGILGDLEAAQRMHERLMASPSVDVDSHTRYALVQLGVQGDTHAYARALEQIPPARRADLEIGYFQLPYLQRDYERAEQYLAAFPGEVIEDQDVLAPKSLLRALLARAGGQAEAAARDAAEALALLERRTADYPEDFRARMSAALALALLGRGDEARSVVQQVLAQPEIANDRYRSAEIRADELRVLALTADSAQLAAAIEQYLGVPMKTWFWDGLVLDPVFDAHREHPAMRALAARHSRPDAVRGAAP